LQLAHLKRPPGESCSKKNSKTEAQVEVEDEVEAETNKGNNVNWPTQALP